MTVGEALDWWWAGGSQGPAPPQVSRPVHPVHQLIDAILSPHLPPHSFPPHPGPGPLPYPTERRRARRLLLRLHPPRLLRHHLHPLAPQRRHIWRPAARAHCAPAGRGRRRGGPGLRGQPWDPRDSRSHLQPKGWHPFKPGGPEEHPRRGDGRRVAGQAGQDARVIALSFGVLMLGLLGCDCF